MVLRCASSCRFPEQRRDPRRGRRRSDPHPPGAQESAGTHPDIRVAAEASDGEEALSLLTKGEIDVALLDVRMPRKTGVEVLEAMRAWSKAPPAIVLTTFDDDSAILAAVAAGAKGFLLKDVTRD